MHVLQFPLSYLCQIVNQTQKITACLYSGEEGTAKTNYLYVQINVSFWAVLYSYLVKEL